MNVISGLVLGAGGISYPARRIFLKIILEDSEALKKRCPVDASEILTMYLIAENLLNVWDVIKDEFKNLRPSKTNA